MQCYINKILIAQITTLRNILEWKPWSTWTSRDGLHYADDIFKRIFLNKNLWISLKISLKFVPKVPINIILALVQIMVWHRTGDKPLSEPMMVSLLTHVCVTRPQWIKKKSFTLNYNYHKKIQQAILLDRMHTNLPFYMQNIKRIR